jgi:hypothetical protein
VGYLGAGALQDTDRSALVDQSTHQVCADETGAASNQDPIVHETDSV